MVWYAYVPSIGFMCHCGKFFHTLLILLSIFNYQKFYMVIGFSSIIVLCTICRYGVPRILVFYTNFVTVRKFLYPRYHAPVDTLLSWHRERRPHPVDATPIMVLKFSYCIWCSSFLCVCICIIWCVHNSLFVRCVSMICYNSGRLTLSKYYLIKLIYI